MKRKIFAAIDVGSYELGMKIMEISPQRGMRELEHIRHRLDLGTQSYKTGKLGYEKMEELCRVLKEYVAIMNSYKTDDYCAYGTSAIRELDNTLIVLDRIERRTGVRINVLSNSEQRFLDYKSIAAKGEEFEKIIRDNTAVLDIGGGSIQISLFEKSTLSATQNLRLGVLRLHDLMRNIAPKPSQMQAILEEMVDNELSAFGKLYIKDKKIENLILVDDYVSLVVKRLKGNDKQKGFISKSVFESSLEELRKRNTAEVARELVIPEENVPLFFISALLLKGVLDITGADTIWAPGVSLCDGIAYDYAKENHLLPQFHDFEQDIVSCAQSMIKRYQGSKKRSEAVAGFAHTIFDSTRKLHGLGNREKILLNIAALLNDCGRFISLSAVGECSYQIIMATEIIGLSHGEREIVANVVKYTHMDFEYYEEMVRRHGLEKDEYLRISKLTAILRLAVGLERSRKMKITSMKATLHDDELFIQVESPAGMELEKGLFAEGGKFFEEVYSIRPVLKMKKTI